MQHRMRHAGVTLCSNNNKKMHNMLELEIRFSKFQNKPEIVGALYKFSLTLTEIVVTAIIIRALHLNKCFGHTNAKNCQKLSQIV